VVDEDIGNVIIIYGAEARNFSYKIIKFLFRDKILIFTFNHSDNKTGT
jgi:hypothetical protein